MADPQCLCSHGIRPLGKLHGINMGQGEVRLSTHPRCPIHALCQGYTKAYRAKQPKWSNPWCPVHGTKDCGREVDR